MDSPTPADERESGGDPGVPRAPRRPSPALVRRVRRSLLAFFDDRARDLPWRTTRDPYRIWVSEVMLQQTRVETVIPYYRRWVDRFPDLASLASAPEAEVLKLWEGLGYYRRARMLHEAARRIHESGGAVPDTVEGLKALPGVGDYTAGAVASIAFQRVAPAVDGNVRRVLARILDLPSPSPAELRDLAARFVAPERPGDFNQALMELGATVCTPSVPSCSECPVEGVCRARALGVQHERPAPRRRSPVARAEFGVAVPVGPGGDGERRVALVRRPVDGMLGGLWEFPATELKEGEGASSAARRAATELGLAVGEPERELPVVDHVYSHLRARYRPYLFRLEDAPPEGRDGGPRWMDAADLEAAALPRAQRVIAESLEEVIA